MNQSVTFSHAASTSSLPGRNPMGLVLLFIAFAVALVAANWTVLHAVNIELGDFAANSLLIQDAKSLALLKGNYSRVGFNHPGPAILYVLAFGELVFHDWLGLAPSAFSGQLTAVALYSAFWLTLIFAALRKLTGSNVAAMLALAVFAFASVLLDYQVFFGIWFPHLYFFPFAAMLVAAMRYADGYTDTLPTLALASGFLVNGHVSFVAILGIILLTVLAASFRRARRAGVAPFLLSKPFLAAHRRSLIAFLAIFALFLVPLLIETVLHFPGPVAQYAGFSGQNKSNSIIKAFRFVSVYWGGTRFPALAALVLMGLLWLHVRGDDQPFARSVRAALTVFAGATLALLFYAKFGVDMLDQVYIGLFYYAVPALAAAFGVLCVWRALAPSRQGPVALGIVLLFAAGTLYLAREPVIYLSQYNEPAVPQTHELLKALPHQGRLVLDLDYSKDANFVWSRVLGIEAYGKRHGDQFLCLNRNWHISNTASARCTEEEVKRGPRYLVRMTEPGLPPPAAQGMGLSFYRIEAPDLGKTPAMTVALQREAFNAQFLGSGWSEAESEFVWSQGREAVLVLPLSPDFQGSIELDLGAFLPLPDSVQTLTIDAGAGSSAPVDFRKGQERRRVKVPLRAGAQGEAIVKLTIQNPVSPQRLGLSQDTRELGVSLYGFNIEGK